jgi:hypothetical protein
MLIFPDGTKVRVTGLNEILADLYSEGRQPTRETAEEILDRLEKNSNYIPPSARWEYKTVLLKEYSDYIESSRSVPTSCGKKPITT